MLAVKLAELLDLELLRMFPLVLERVIIFPLALFTPQRYQLSHDQILRLAKYYKYI